MSKMASSRLSRFSHGVKITDFSKNVVLVMSISSICEEFDGRKYTKGKSVKIRTNLWNLQLVLHKTSEQIVPELNRPQVEIIIIVVIQFS